MCYYENKLAYLRDYFTQNKKSIEGKIYPLNYLLEFFNYLQFNNNTWELNTENTNHEYKIVYANDITEQDYNGTFSDMIFVINLNDWKTCRVNNLNKEEVSVDKYTPEVLFSQMRTSSNYNEERTGAGINGLGVKLVTILSKVITAF